MTHMSYFVVYCLNLAASKAFYESLGFSFLSEKHGNGPEHFSCLLGGGTVFELYPTKTPVSGARFGVRILGRKPGIFRDPDGNCIEITA